MSNLYNFDIYLLSAIFELPAKRHNTIFITHKVNNGEFKNDGNNSVGEYKPS